MSHAQGYDSALGPYERYTVTLHGTAWHRAEDRALLAAWKAARELGIGLTPAQADKIAHAAIDATRDMIERHALDQQAAQTEDSPMSYDRTPEQMLADLLRRRPGPEDTRDAREDLAQRLEAFGERVEAAGPKQLTPEMNKERTQLFEAARDLAPKPSTGVRGTHD